MTRTEDRLADALGAVAGAVPAETLRPLVAPSPRRARPAWLAPAAAAASIVVLAGLVATGTAVFGTGAGKRAAPPPPVPAAARAAVPRYYAGGRSGPADHRAVHRDQPGHLHAADPRAAADRPGRGRLGRSRAVLRRRGLAAGGQGRAGVPVPS